MAFWTKIKSIKEIIATVIFLVSLLVGAITWIINQAKNEFASKAQLIETQSDITAEIENTQKILLRLTRLWYAAEIEKISETIRTLELHRSLSEIERRVLDEKRQRRDELNRQLDAIPVETIIGN